jgi:hypothetical protein
VSMKSLVASTPSGRTRPLLIDDAAYITVAVRQGAPIPWTDTAQLVRHFGQVRGLLDPDAIWIDIQHVYEGYVSTRPGLVTEMGARTRVGYPLRTLLGNEDLLSDIREALTSVAGMSRRQLVLRIPSPVSWLLWAQELAGNPIGEVDDMRADSASMYIAEWLGRLGTIPVALALLDGRGTAGDVVERLSSYTAIANVTSHFDWSLAVWTDSGIETAAGEPAIGVLPTEFWSDGAEVPACHVLVTAIPATAIPEQVLERLRELQ